MSKARSNNVPLFEGIHGKDYVLQNKLCRECGTQVQGKRTRWCSDECVGRYNIRRNPAYARKLVRKRDKRVCAVCKLDTNLPQKARAAITKKFGRFKANTATPQIIATIQKALEPWDFQAWWKRKSFWDMDHIVPVYKGGGECDLNNLRSLCVACHAKVTIEQAAERAAMKAENGRKKPDLQS